MPRDGSGTYTLPSPPSPLLANTLAKAEDVMSIYSDIAAALTASVNTAGTAPWTGSQNANNYSLAGLNTLTTATLHVTGSTSLDGGIAGALTINGATTMLGGLNVTGGNVGNQGLTFSYGSYAHAHQLYWDGGAEHIIVDGNDQGTIASETWTFNNFLPLTGGTVSGPLTVTGLAHISDTLQVENGIQYGYDSFNNHHQFYWDGSLEHVIVDGVDHGGLATHTWANGQFLPFTGGTISGTLTVNGNLTASWMHSTGDVQIDGKATVTGDAYVSNLHVTAGGGIIHGPGTSSNFYIDNALSLYIHTTNGIFPNDPGVQWCGNNTYYWAEVVANVVTQLSDVRMKRDIEPVPNGCLPIVAAVQPICYRWREGRDDARHLGFNAQELADVSAELVTANDEGTLFVRPLELTAVLWKAVQELSARVAALEGPLTAARG